MKVVSQQQRTGTDGTDRICAAAQYLCADSEHGRRTTSSRSSGFACFSAIRHGRKTTRFSFRTRPRYRRNWHAATAIGQPAEYAGARYGRNAAHIHRRALYPARAADDARFHEWKHPDHAAEPCFSPAVQWRSTPNQRSPYGWPLHKSGASGSRSAVFQPRSWYTSALDHTA